MNLSFEIAKLVGRFIFGALRLKKYSATSLPGLVALKIDPDFISQGMAKTDTVLVTGTNGKTTTTNRLSSIIKDTGIDVCVNSTGSNLPQGIATAIIRNTKQQFGVFEIDEAYLGYGIKNLRPRLVILLNLFRDQMDRYGEMAKTREVWIKAIKAAPPECLFLINGDDPMLAEIGSNGKNVIYFGLNDKNVGTRELDNTADSLIYYKNLERLSYSRIYYSHLGIYEDAVSGFKRPDPTFYAQSIKLDGLKGSQFEIKYPSGIMSLKIKMPGLFNVYDALAASAGAQLLGIPPKQIKASAINYDGVFGRNETVHINSRALHLFLTKNPVSFNQIIDTIINQGKESNIIIGINSNLADGQDVSWLWDTNLEKLTRYFSNFVVTGDRAEDMALRLKYAGSEVKNIKIIKNYPELLDYVAGQPDNKHNFCLLNYTTLLELRKILVKNNLVKPI